nr:PREDICTED: AN1-type zinc finger protein 4-like isoform X2 [Bemisia tabaci]
MDDWMCGLTAFVPSIDELELPFLALNRLHVCLLNRSRPTSYRVVVISFLFPHEALISVRFAASPLPISRNYRCISFSSTRKSDLFIVDVFVLTPSSSFLRLSGRGMDNNASHPDPWSSSKSKTFKIFIDPLQGSIFELTVQPAETLLSVKMKIEELKGIPVKQQQLLLNLKELDDESTLEKLSIMDQTTLQLVLSLRSGPVSTLRKIIPAMSSTFLKDLIMQNRKEIGSLEPGTRLSIMVFRDGTKVRVFKMLEKLDSSVAMDPLLAVSSSSSSKQLVLKGERSKHHEDSKGVQKVKLIKAKLLEMKNSKKKAVDSNENYSPFMNQILSENVAPSKKKLPPLSSTLTTSEEPSPRKKIEFSQVPVLPNIGPNMLPSHHASVSQGSGRSTLTSIIDNLAPTDDKTFDLFGMHERKEPDCSAPKRRSSSIAQDVSPRGEGLKLKPPIGIVRKLEKKSVGSGCNQASTVFSLPGERKNFSVVNKQLSFLSSQNLIPDMENDDYVPAQKTLATAPEELLPLEPEFSDDFTPVKKKSKQRCSECRKKLTISNMYECRCGLLLCSMHRYSEAHNCSFDYKTEGRKLIKKVNPLVIASKLPKI